MGWVVGPQPRLDVGEGNPELRGGERARQGGVRVTKDEHAVRPLFLEHRTESLHDPCRLLRVTGRAHPEKVARLPEAYRAAEQLLLAPSVALAVRQTNGGVVRAR